MQTWACLQKWELFECGGCLPGVIAGRWRQAIKVLSLRGPVGSFLFLHPPSNVAEARSDVHCSGVCRQTSKLCLLIFEDNFFAPSQFCRHGHQMPMQDYPENKACLYYPRIS